GRTRSRRSGHGRDASRAECVSRRPVETGVRGEEGGQDGRPAGRGTEPVETRRPRRGPAAEPVSDPRGVPRGAGALTRRQCATKTTSLTWFRTIQASCVPSCDQSNVVMGPELKSVSFRGGRPSRLWG